VDQTATAPGSLADPGAGPASAATPAGAASTALRLLRWLRLVAGVVPFGVYVALGLVIPMIAVLIGAFQNPANGGFTVSNVKTATHGVYLHGYWESILLSIWASVLPAILGLLIAYAIFTAKRGSVLRQLVITTSGVFANFGGVPLAFLFIAALGGGGLLTGWIQDVFHGLWDGSELFTLSGVVLVYLYFQIPLMVLVILPGLEGLRTSWREAAENLGAGTWQYWRYVGGPVLMPTFLGCVLLLFGSSLSAYATAQAMTSGTIPLTSIQIGTFLNGNVLPGQGNVGKALSLGLVLIIAVAMVLYVLLQRRASRWLR
jgi:putative spermidine/putrescine transport system permease protein